MLDRALFAALRTSWGERQADASTTSQQRFKMGDKVEVGGVGQDPYRGRKEGEESMTQTEGFTGGQ